MIPSQPPDVTGHTWVEVPGAGGESCARCGIRRRDPLASTECAQVAQLMRGVQRMQTEYNPFA